MRFTAGVIQFDPVLFQVERNLSTIESLAADAAKAGANLLVAPEMATTGYLFMSRDEALPYSETVPGPSTDRLAALCARLGAYLVVGVLERDEHTGFLYNTAALIGPSGYVGKYRKTHPFLADTRWAVDGDLGFPVFDLPFCRLGIMVCMDVSYFETARLAAVAGAQVLAFPLNSRQPSPTEQWSVRASENGFYVLASNRSGFERGTRFSGGSSIVGPSGAVLGTVAGGAGFVVAEIDTDQCGQDTLGFGRPVLGRRPEAYYPLVLSPYTWTSREVFGLAAEGSPGVLAVPASGAPADVRAACEAAWVEFSKTYRATPDILLLPERSLGGTGGLPAQLAVAWGTEAAEALGCTLAFGFEENAVDGQWNSIMLVTPRGESHMYRQVHVAPADAGRVRAGSSLKVVDLWFGRVGLCLGADLYYPETTRCLAQMGADMVLAGAERDISPIAAMLRERARSNHLHTAVACSRGPSMVYPGEELKEPGSPAIVAGAAGDLAARVLPVSRGSAIRTKPMLQKRRPELYMALCV